VQRHQACVGNNPAEWTDACAKPSMEDVGPRRVCTVSHVGQESVDQVTMHPRFQQPAPGNSIDGEEVPTTICDMRRRWSSSLL